MSQRYIVNNAASTVVADFDPSTQNTILVDNASLFGSPTTNNWIGLTAFRGRSPLFIAQVTNIQNNTLTVAGAIEGTSPQPLRVLDRIACVVTAGCFDGIGGGDGADGPQGDQGYRGYQGYQGIAGATGYQGATGSQGQAGIGSQGFQGNVGATGTSGSQGASGGSGPQGNQGGVGSAGTSGTQGNQGVTGPAGPQGNAIAGTQGLTGATGPQGNQGIAGTGGGSSSPGGSNQQIQYNNGGAFAGGTQAYVGSGGWITLAPSQTNPMQLQCRPQSGFGDFQLNNGSQGIFRMLPYLNDIYFENTYRGSLYFRSNTDPSAGPYILCATMNPSSTMSVNSGNDRAQLDVTVNGAGTVGEIIQLSSSQTADALQVINNTGTALAKIKADGSIGLASLADGSATNGSLYFSTTTNKLTFKDSGGTLHSV